MAYSSATLQALCSRIKLGGQLIFEQLKFWAVGYFSKYGCPRQFSLTSEDAKTNDFYETRIFFPQADYKKLEGMSVSERNHCRVLYTFLPNKNGLYTKNLIKGKKFIDGVESSDCYVSASSLQFVRIDVTYYYGHWQVSEKNCSSITLIKLVFWRAFRLIWADIFVSKMSAKYDSWMISKRLRTPLKSKFEIYESLMKNEKFLTSGNFRRSDISFAILGDKKFRDYTRYKKFSQSLDWILDACVEDGEIIRINPNGQDIDPLYKMKGKGIHYFTLTKEQIKNEEHNKQIQKNQVSIQNRMLFLTFLLVIATFMTALDKFDEAWVLVVRFTDWIVQVLG